MIRDRMGKEDFGVIQVDGDKQREMEKFRTVLDKSGKSLNLIVSDDGGQVYTMSLQPLLKSHGLDKKADNSSKKKAFNPYRYSQQSSFNGLFTTEQELIAEFSKKTLSSPLPLLKKNSLIIPEQQYCMDDLPWFKFKASNEQLLVLTIIKVPPKLICTSAGSRVIKMWSVWGEGLCVLDIDQPLPYKWGIQGSAEGQREHKYRKAVEVIKEIESSYRKEANNTNPSSTLAITSHSSFSKPPP